MTDPTSGSVPRCPWCSAALPVPGVEQCPSCGAQLVTTPGAETDIKGVTSLDAEAILRARSELNRPRTRLLSLITGDEAEAASARENQASLAQPSSEVRREMARLEMEARRAAEEAERTALRADAMAQLGIHVDDLPAEEAAVLAGHEAPDPGAGTDPAATADDSWPAELHPVDDGPVDDTEDPPAS
jgi:hypothetical protein